MKQALFIGFDGTLCHDKPWRSLDPGLRQKVNKYIFGENRDLGVEWMRGDYVSEDVHKILSEKLGVDYSMLWDIFVSDCKKMKVNEEGLEGISRLRDKYCTFLVTDNTDGFDRFTVPSLGLNARFNGIINSYNEKIFKSENNGYLFIRTLEEMGGSPEESVLIDSSALTCAVFEKLGGRVFLATKERPLEYWLRELGRF